MAWRRLGHSSLDLTSLPPSKRSGSGKKGMLGSAWKLGGNTRAFWSHDSHGSLLGNIWSICSKASFCFALVWAKIDANENHDSKSASADGSIGFLMVSR